MHLLPILNVFSSEKIILFMFSSSKASCSNHLLANSKRSSLCLWMVSRSCCTCCLLLSLFLTKNVLIVLALQSKSSSSLVELLVAVGLALIKSSIFCCSSEVSDLEWHFLFGLLGSSFIWYMLKKYYFLILYIFK